MEKYGKAIEKCSLFRGIKESEIQLILNCLQAKIKTFDKGALIFAMGEKIERLGVVLSGSVFIEKADCWGNRSILAKAVGGDVFGEAMCCAEQECSQVDVTAAEKTAIMFVDYKKIITTCSSACVFHTALIENMLKILADKNLMLTGKIEHLTRRSTKEKLLSYLSYQSLQKGSADFEIPFNRQELADYLAVDRSAMSNELSKLRNDGVLEFHKNHFHLNEVEI